MHTQGQPHAHTAGPALQRQGLRQLPTWALGLALVQAALWQPRAQACGGFFCSNAASVNQAAERIIFSANGDGTVTAVVQIQYEGPAERFSWVLPVPGTPDVGVSSNMAFQRLQSASNPVYQLQTEVRGECLQDEPFAAPGSVDATSNAGLAEEGSPVEVLDGGRVGPYDYVTIAAVPGLADAADVVVEWLQDNGYDVDDTGRTTLRPYLDKGMNLIAFRLTKGNDAGEIRPVTLRYDSTRPMIPIRPTAVAANDDMGVMVWVLGPHRAVPINYLGLEINEARVNWFNPTPTYNDLIIEAANEAGGHGFVTELAGATEALATAVFADNDEANWRDNFQQQDWNTNPRDLIVQLVSVYGSWDGLRRALENGLTLADGVTMDALFNCASCVSDSIEAFDPGVLLAAVEDEVIKPMRETRDLLRSRPYVTRLYTTLSAAEMTDDPAFDFNPELPDWSNIRTATQVIECDGQWTQREAPWSVTLAQGMSVRGQSNTWPFTGEAAADMPANLRVLQFGTAGPGIVLTDNSAQVQAQVEAWNEEQPEDGGFEGGAGCQTAPWTASQGLAGMLWALLALVWWRRRALA